MVEAQVLCLMQINVFIQIISMIFLLQTVSAILLVNSTIPQYLGVGYNLLHGNPNTNKIDPGFTVPIFGFTYKQNKHTDDEKYIIPDYVSSASSTSCSLNSMAYKYSGTQNYQKELSTKVKFQSKFSFAFVKAAFSMSSQFQKISNSSVKQKKTTTQATADCQAYRLSLPLFSRQIPLSQDFINGVDYAYKANDWSSFFNHFGSHFSDLVILGGRAIMEHSFSMHSMSMFEGMHLDVQLSARASFSRFFKANTSADVQRYQNQSKLVDTYSEESRQIFLGGRPPEDGNFKEWEKTVKDNLAPITYNLQDITLLFQFVPNIDVAKAVKEFSDHIDRYCSTHGCQGAIPDRPNPPAPKLTYSHSDMLKGSQYPNQHFNDTFQGLYKTSYRIRKVYMGSQGTIDMVQFILGDGLTQMSAHKIGERAINHEYTVPAHDEIRCIRFGIKQDGGWWRFGSFQFVTKKGIQSQVYKGTFQVQQHQSLCVHNDDEHIMGFYGLYSTSFNGIGLNIMKEDFQY